MYTFRFLNQLFYCSAFPVCPVSPRLLIKEALYVNFLDRDDAQGTDPFDLLIGAIGFGCAELLCAVIGS